LKPIGVSKENQAPGVVYIHGYQNNRETSDVFAIEMARRGFIVVEIDAIGRGNSGNPDDIDDL
jgi:dipeptidyl aminopeptidase/acylaminoacyl peptidase